MVAAPHGEDDRVNALCHDLRQYVAAGLLMSEAGQERNPGSETSVRLATIHTVFEQIGLLVNAETEDPGPRRTRLDLRQIVTECVQVAQSRPDVAIETWLAPRAAAYGDPVLLRRAVANVLDNAVRAAGDHGSIVVRLFVSGGESIIEVTDDGVGFGRTPRGSGQGMSVVAMAVDACRGRLEIVSGPAPGTTVRLVLPGNEVV